MSTAGAGHSFTPIVETDGVLLDHEPADGNHQHRPGAFLGHGGAGNNHRRIRSASVGTGSVLSNQGDIDAQAIAGAIATATHGSGRHFPNFSAVLEGARLVDGTGTVIEVSRTQNADLLPAVQTSIGVLGILTEVTIKVAPAYKLHARTDIMKFDEVMDRFEHRRRGLPAFRPLLDANRRVGPPLQPRRRRRRRLRRQEVPGIRPRRPCTRTRPHERFGPAYQIYPMVYDPNFHEVEYFLPLEQAREILDRDAATHDAVAAAERLSVGDPGGSAG